MVRAGGDRAGAIARGGQAVPVRGGTRLLRSTVGGLGAHVVLAGRADGRRGGAGVRGGATRAGRRGRAALGRGREEPGAEVSAARALPARAPTTGHRDGNTLI